jgi:hypothetical protein
MATEQNESAIRRKAARRGYRVHKSRQRFHCNNHGEFQLVDEYNHIVLGADYDATLEDIADFLKDEQVPA